LGSTTATAAITSCPFRRLYSHSTASTTNTAFHPISSGDPFHSCSFDHNLL
jgi:hypothetical protein